MEIDELKDFIETVDDFEPPGLITICMVHTIWYLLRSSPQKIKNIPLVGSRYCLTGYRDIIYESIKSMFNEREQPIPVLTSYAFERGLEHLHQQNLVLYVEKKSKTGATMVLPPQAQNPEDNPNIKLNRDENLCWLIFEEYDKAKVDDLINYCANDLRDACEGAEIYSWNEVKDEKLRSVFLNKLDPNKLNKLKIMDMIEQTEDMLRRLLVRRYEKHVGWTRKKEYVPDDIISKMYTDDFEPLKTCPSCKGEGTIADGEQECKRCKGKGVAGFRGWIDKKADDASYFRGKIKILSHVHAFVNACTLGEAMEIIEYRKGNFTEKKNKETKKLEGGPYKKKELQRAIDNFEELEKIRNKRSHLDEQIKWGAEMVKTTEILTNAIIEPIVNYLNR